MTVPARVFRQTLRSLLEPIACFLDSEDVSEIMINAHDEIYVERHGRLYITESRFPSEYSLLSALRNLSQYVGRELSTNKPILEARLPDGSRVEAVIPPASPRGASACIRLFPKERLTLETLLESRAISNTTADLLRAIVRDKHNVVVSGGSGSGKTSLLNALSCLISEDERVIVIEDAQELQLRLPHVVQLEAQPPDSRGQGVVTIRELFHATLRMRPDRVVIGEIRGGEALDLIQAMTSGHRGCLSTVHGTIPADTLSRLETMALMNEVRVPLDVLRRQIASAIDDIIQVARLADGHRCVTHIVEVCGYDRASGYKLRSLFERSSEREGSA